MMLKRNPPGRSLVRYRIFDSKKKASQFCALPFFLVQKDLLLEHFFLTIQNQKYGTFVDVKRSTMYVFKMVFKNFSSKSFQQKNSSNGKKRFAQILSNDFHAFSKADIKQF